MSDKRLIPLNGEIKAPPFSKKAQDEAGFRLRELQQGIMLSMPKSRPMPSIGARCHELRVQDKNANWRIIYRIDEDAILIADVFSKKTEATPLDIIDNCRKRFSEYDKR